MRPHRVGAGSDGIRRTRRLGIGVHANLAEVIAEALLRPTTERIGQRDARPGEDRIDDARSHGVAGLSARATAPRTAGIATAGTRVIPAALQHARSSP